MNRSYPSPDVGIIPAAQPTQHAPHSSVQLTARPKRPAGAARAQKDQTGREKYRTCQLTVTTYHTATAVSACYTDAIESTLNLLHSSYQHIALSASHESQPHRQPIICLCLEAGLHHTVSSGEAIHYTVTARGLSVGWCGVPRLTTGGRIYHPSKQLSESIASHSVPFRSATAIYSAIHTHIHT